MTTYVPAKKGAEYIFYISLVSQSTGQFQANPTLAAGDFKVSIDGAALANLATLPAVTPATSKSVKVTLSTSEMNGDNIIVIGSDAAGAEWDDVFINIQTAARQIDDLATPTNITAGTITTATNVTTVNGLAANVITAASINADAITAAKIADGAIDAATFAASAITSTVLANDAITAAKVAADVSAEIADAVWDEDATGHQTQGTFGQAIGDPVADTNTIYKAVVTDATGATVGADVVAVKTETASIQSDTNDIQARLPAALVGGRMDADMGAISTDATAADNLETMLDGTGGQTLSLKQLNIVNGSGVGIYVQASGGSGVYIEGDAGIEVYGLADTGMYLFGAGNGDGLFVAGDGTGKSISAPQDIELSDGTLNLQAIEDEVWDATMADHLDGGTTGAALNGAGAAGDPWGTTLPGAYGAGTAGKIIGDNINAAISSRATQTSVDDLPTNAELATALGTADDAVLAQVALVKTETDKIASVKAKTDSLTFTTAGQVDANVQAVNDTELTGDGSAVPWGPA
jgi:hypothetical protein